MKTLTFMLTAGYPYEMSEPEMMDKINAMVEEVQTNLSTLPGVKYERGNIYKVRSVEDGTTQARCIFWVTKKGRTTTWDTIMGEVNKTYAPKYQFC